MTLKLRIVILVEKVGAFKVFLRISVVDVDVVAVSRSSPSLLCCRGRTLWLSGAEPGERSLFGGGFGRRFDFLL